MRERGQRVCVLAVGRKGGENSDPNGIGLYLIYSCKFIYQCSVLSGFYKSFGILNGFHLVSYILDFSLRIVNNSHAQNTNFN